MADNYRAIRAIKKCLGPHVVVWNRRARLLFFFLLFFWGISASSFHEVINLPISTGFLRANSMNMSLSVKEIHHYHVVWQSPQEFLNDNRVSNVYHIHAWLIITPLRGYICIISSLNMDRRIINTASSSSIIKEIWYSSSYCWVIIPFGSINAVLIPVQVDEFCTATTIACPCIIRKPFTSL